jgi:hypothetical protein
VQEHGGLLFIQEQTSSVKTGDCYAGWGCKHFSLPRHGIKEIFP